MKIHDILSVATVIPVFEVPKLELAAPLARAFSNGGLRVIEVTMRTQYALEAVKLMRNAAPNLIIGMGSILSAENVQSAVSAGAQFLVSPGSTPTLLGALKSSGAPSLPAVASATEAMAAHEAGFSFLKFFPAEPIGGIAYLSALNGPLPELVFCPTGSISADMATQYLALPNVICVGGSWIAPKSAIQAGDWLTIEANARLAASLG